MIGIIQLRKYRAMRAKYGAGAGIGMEAPSDYTMESMLPKESITETNTTSTSSSSTSTSLSSSSLPTSSTNTTSSMR